MKNTKYVKLGILIIVSLFILIWGLSFLKGNDVFSSNKYYYVVYERIDGLLVSSKITLNGYQVGQVSDIQFVPGNSGKLVVKLTTDASFNIPENSVAQIISSDIMGTRSIKMVFSNSDDYYQPGDTIPGAIESDLKEQVSLQVLPLKNKAEQLLNTIDSAITTLTVILNEDARKDLSESFNNINNTINNIELITSDLQEVVSSQKENIKKTVGNIESITRTISSNSKELDKAIKNFSVFSDTLAKMQVTPIINNISAASDQILSLLEKLNSTDNTAGMLLNDDELYLSITALSDNLGYLINDIQTNPKRYLQVAAIDFGKEYYIGASGGDATAKNVVFKVHLVSTEAKIPADSEYFKGIGNVEEYYANGAYSYLIGSTSIYSEILKIHESVRKKFPESTIVAFKNGQLIKLEKAMKFLN